MSAASIFAAAAALAAAGAAAGGALAWLAAAWRGGADGAARRFAEELNGCLPQLQCGECGYAGCAPYAAALAAGEAGVELCPPGGADVARRLAALLGTAAPAMPAAAPLRVARIAADECVGCGLCLPVCPTDAILGAPRFLHVVDTAHCVGCELCLPPCPVDCIEMVEDKGSAVGAGAISSSEWQALTVARSQ